MSPCLNESKIDEAVEVRSGKTSFKGLLFSVPLPPRASIWFWKKECDLRIPCRLSMNSKGRNIPEVIPFSLIPFKFLFLLPSVDFDSPLLFRTCVLQMCPLNW
jgi:hypothetical protein